DEGLLAEHPLSVLAERVHLGERQLRRLFVERLGAPPIGVHGTRRLLFAKQLLTDTALPITDVAMAAGFGSLRRFNTTDRKSTRLNSSHVKISYAVFCLKKKNKLRITQTPRCAAY